MNELFTKELVVINMGLESFYEDLKNQGVSTAHVQWKPAAGGDKKMSSLLGRLKGLK